MQSDDSVEVTRTVTSNVDPTPSVDTPTTSTPELPRGATFGRYVVARKLGSGGMGVVYLAYDPQLDRGVALKLLRPGERTTDRGAARDRLLREAQAMARLSHPNVVPVYDVGAVGSHVFMAMEHVEGRTLSRWIEQERPGWPAVLEVFVGAGRGLAAAHAAGLVHRDFKPDNVMIDDTGRPRVMDFGLARAPEDELEPHESRVTDSELAAVSGARSRASISTSMSLTRTGFVLGTPAYMPPEQHMGKAIDPASDQFSLCVAFYVGIYGERPFAGESGTDLCRAALDGAIRPAPPGSRVPHWLRRVIVRGLAPTPAGRWPSMDAMLDALTAQRRRAQRIRTVVPAVALLGAVVGGSIWWQGQREQPCQTSEAALASAWNDERREAIRASFDATELAFAASAADRAALGIDAWSERWIAQHRDACEATYVRHEQSENGLDLRMSCLQGRRRALEGLLGVLDSAQASTVERSADAVDALPRPERCADLEALEAEVPPPEDADVRTKVQDLMAALDRVDSLVAAARFEQARVAIDEVHELASEVPYRPLHAELRAREAGLLESEGKLDEAIDAFESTLWQAESLQMDPLATRMAIRLAWLDGAERNEQARGEMWAALAGAKLDRIGDPPRLRAQLLQMKGGIADANGDYEEAAGYFEDALTRWSKLAPNSVEHARALADFGKTHFRAGRFAEAAATFEQAANALAEALGPWHPNVGMSWANAGAAHHARGDYDRARANFEQGLRVIEAAYGPDHLNVAAVLTNLGNVHLRAGDYDAAIATGRRAIAIKEVHLGKGHAKIGLNLNNVALALSEQGRHEEALAAFHEAEVCLASLGPDHVALVEPQIGIGEELMHLGRHAEAIEPLESAYRRQKAQPLDPTRLALPAFMLARALWDGGGDRPRAVALALEAQQALGEADTAELRKLADALAAWRQEHTI